MNFFCELLLRIKAETPPFFKLIRSVGTAVITFCTPIVAIPSTYIGINLHPLVIKVCSHLLVAGVIMVSLSSLTKNDSKK